MATEYLTLEEVCERLKINVLTARNRFSQGKKMPPCVRIGKKRLFPENRFEEWMDRQVESNDELILKRFSGGKIKR